MSNANDERKKSYPNEPWRWNPEWAEGRIHPFEKPGTISGSIIGYWVLAILVLGTFHLIPRAAKGMPFWPEGAVFWGLGLLMGLFGFIALYLAVKRTKVWKRYGQSGFPLKQILVFSVANLRQTFVRQPHSSDAHAHLRLVCVHHSHTNSFVSVTRRMSGRQAMNLKLARGSCQSSSICQWVYL